MGFSPLKQPQSLHHLFSPAICGIHCTITMPVPYGGLYCLCLIISQASPLAYSCFSVWFNEIPEIGKYYEISSEDIGMDKGFEVFVLNF